VKKYFPYLPYVIFSLALFGTVGSLFASEIMHLPPCVLCWYQRICMYPMVVIGAVGILKKDKNFLLYILPLGIIGWLYALYHNLLYFGIIPEAVAPCQNGVSCTAKLFQIFGFIDIPLGSFFIFTLINVCTIIYLKYRKV
jgi:disulfide bond formation protein DsbB